MTYPPLLYAKVLDNSDDNDADYLLTGKQRYLLQAILNSVQDNPSLYFADYSAYTPDDIDTLIDACMTALIEEDVLPTYRSVESRIKLDQYFPITNITYSQVTGEPLPRMIFGNVQNTNYTVVHVSLLPGTYTITAMCPKANSQGILTLQDVRNITPVDLCSWDLYSSSPVAIARIDNAGIALAGSNEWRFRLINKSKNGSSSGYSCQIMYLEFTRTGP